MTSHDPCLAATRLIDSDHAAVAAFARRHAVGLDRRERAVALYYAVRDQFRYDPYRIDLSPQGMCASTVLTSGLGWCVTKAALLAAACGAGGIPARLGYADVRNHLSTERLRTTLKTDLFVWHGYTGILFDGVWLKATPAFNIGLCDRFDLLPLEFVGREDSIYHPFDRAGNHHMEYVNMRGAFDDLPLDLIVAGFEETYPAMMADMNANQAADFAADAEREVR